MKAKGSSDNGLNFEVRVEVEAFTSTSDQIDENWAKVSGAFGEVYVGGADTALNEYGGVGVLYSSGPFNYYDPDVSLAPGAATFIGKDDALSIRYGTPVINGFQAGVSYQPNGNVDGLNDRPVATPSLGGGGLSDVKDQIAFGASWEGAVSGVALGHVGAEAGYAGFTVAAFWNQDDAGVGSDRYGVGAEYRTGPWKVGGGFSQADGANEGMLGSFGFTYALAPGVDAVGVVQVGDQTGDGIDTSWAAATALAVRF